MRKNMRWLTVTSALALSASLAAPLAAQVAVPRHPGGNGPWGGGNGGVYGRNNDYRGAAYDNGYREGYRQGERDSRDRRNYDFRRHGDYRDGDNGFRGGDRNDYKRDYRRGFEQGYSQGYRRDGGGWGGNPTWGGGGWGGYPDRGRGGWGGNYAWQKGYNDGVDRGRRAADDRRPFDPVRESRYRDGDHDYNRRYGSRDDYKRDYRAGFRDGYERGYRSGRYDDRRRW